MSFNTPMMDSTENKIQGKTMAKNKKPLENKSGSDSTVTEKQKKKQVKKDMNHRWINQDRVQKLKQNGQRNKIVKKYHYNYPVQIITNCENIIQKT